MNHGQNSGGNPQGDPWGGQQGSDPHNDWHQQPHRQPRQRQGRGGKRGAGNLSSALGPGDTAAADAIPEERMSFIRRTYAWLTGAVFLCVAMMGAFFVSPFFQPVMEFMVSTNWLIVLGLFIGFSWLGDWMAHSVESKGIQFIGMLVGVGAYAIIFSYLFLVSGALTPEYGVDSSVLVHAGLLTLVVFGALTAVVFVTKKDFSILRTGLIVLSVLAFGAIAAGVLFGFTLGLGFAVAMVGLCAGLIVYQTSNILHHYPADRHMGAALALFSSVGMLFWYLFMILGFDG